MARVYKFQCAGTFAGVTSFTEDDGEEVNFMKIDFMGGKVNVSVSPEMAKSLGAKKPGCDVRTVGNVLVAGGSFRPVLENVTFEGDKDFEPVTMEEAFSGLVFSGPACVSERRSFSRKDGSIVYEAKFQLFGATLTLPVAAENFDSIIEGQVVIYGQIFSEVKKDFKGGTSSHNWLSILKTKAMSEGVKRR